MRDGVMPSRRLDSFSRYSMPKTESNRPALMLSSCEETGETRPNACCITKRVSLPLPFQRGSAWARTKTSTGSPEGETWRSRLATLRRNVPFPPEPTVVGRNPFTNLPPESIEATSPREFTAGANGST
jgi:hypothetical protein